ncbi:MAG: Uma2 family endonuclease [Candidatus Competibacteraceae bacterium]|nr:Uma2 family endonuclease [Candidatus Competibacteraceae bacterium]
MNAIVEPRCHRITVEEYHQMGEAGIFDEDTRIELLEGELFDMAPIGSRHMSALNKLIYLFYPARDQGIVSVQNPIDLATSEPEPDLALLKSGNYWDHLPTVDEVLLLIEVADRSVQYDREKKIPVYGRCGISETWLVDINARQAEIYREPSSTGYRTVLIRGEQDYIAPLALPELEIALGEIWRT